MLVDVMLLQVSPGIKRLATHFAQVGYVRPFMCFLLTMGHELLWTLATNKNKVFSRDNLLNSLWGYDYFGDTRTVDSHIKRLRAKLDEFDHYGWEIKTIWGVGYKFEVNVDEK